MRRSKWMILIIIYGFLITQNLIAAREESLRIGTTQVIEGEGIKFKSFKNAEARPMMSITSRNMRGTIYKNGIELWKSKQSIGTWGNALGEITIGKPLFAPINSDNLITDSEFKEWEGNQKPKWDNETIAQWIQAYYGVKVNANPKKLKGPRGVICLEYSGSVSKIYYLLNSKNHSQRYLFFYKLKPSHFNDKGFKVILQSLKSISFTKPKKAKSKVITTSKSKYNRNKEWSPEYIASRDQVINNIKNFKDWWYLETENFILVSNLKKKKTISDIQDKIEKARRIYTDYYPIRQPLKAVSICKIFASRPGYQSYVGAEYEWSGGLWMASRKELVISPINWGSTSEQRKMLLKVVYHESFHQFIYFATDAQTAPWFNEGNADFFCGTKLSGKKYTVKKPDAEYNGFISFMKKNKVNIRRLIELDYSSFYSPKERSNNYNSAWALMFFLHKGCRVIRFKNNFHEIPTKYYNDIVQSKNGVQATTVAWEGVDMAIFEEQFIKFWGNKSMIRRAERVEPYIKRK